MIFLLLLWSLGRLPDISSWTVLDEAIDAAAEIYGDSDTYKGSANEMTLALTPLSVALLMGFDFVDSSRFL